MISDTCKGTRYTLDGREGLTYNEAIHHLREVGFTYEEARAYLGEMKAEAAPKLAIAEGQA